MKHLLLLFALSLSLSLTAQDDDGYVMFTTIHIDPLTGHDQQLLDGLKAHNEKFHQEGMDRADVWSIQSGPNSGDLSWVMGPVTWSHFDTPLTDEHMADWNENVSAHANIGEFGYWRLADGLSYMPEDLQPMVLEIRYLDIMPDKGNNARHLLESIIAVYEENELNSGFQIYYNAANSGEGKDWAMLWFYDSWSAKDANMNFGEMYEKKFGEDSWDEFLEGWDEAQDMQLMEIHTLMPKLSAPRMQARYGPP